MLIKIGFSYEGEHYKPTKADLEIQEVLKKSC